MITKTAEFEFPGYVLACFRKDYVFYRGIKDYCLYRQPRARFDGREAPNRVMAYDSFCNKIVPDPLGEYVLVEQPNYVSLNQEIVRYELHESVPGGLPIGLFEWYGGLVQEEEGSVTAMVSEAFGYGDVVWSSEACPDTTYELLGVKNPYAEEYVVLEETYKRGKGTLCSIYAMNAGDGELNLLLEGLGGWTDYKQKRRIIAWFP